MNRNIVMKFRATEEEAAEIRRFFLCRRNERQQIFENVRREKSGGALQHRRHLRTPFRSQAYREQHQSDRYGGKFKQVGVFVRCQRAEKSAQ